MMTRLFDKLGWVVAALVSLVALAAVSGLVSAGPLDPPGPPGSTGKNVITSLPYTINQPGSYVLNGNLTMSTSGNAITVGVNDVTIDMQGFELTGVSPAQRGIQGFSNTNLTVRNGTIRGFTIIALTTGTGADVENVNAIANGRGMSVGYRSTIRNCLVESSTADYGISAGTGVTIDNCRSEGNNLGSGTAYGIQVGDDSVITNSVARYNGGTEILAGARAMLENCVADGQTSAGNGIEVGAGSTVRGCSSSGNGGNEITASDGSTLEDCSADGMGTSGYGIFVGEGAVVRGCSARKNGDAEIYAFGNTLIEDCVADGQSTAGSGIVVWSNSIVRGCTATGNTDYGIYLFGNSNRAENNSATQNGTGFKVDGKHNLGIQNVANCNYTNYSLATPYATYGNEFVLDSHAGGANYTYGDGTTDHVVTDPFVNLFEYGPSPSSADCQY